MNFEAPSDIDRFRLELDILIGLNPDLPLLVTDDQGRHQVVAALEEEPLSALVKRVELVGGNANVYVGYADGSIRYLAVMQAGEALSPVAAHDLTGAEAPSEHATVGMFLDYLRLHPEGVLLPAALPTAQNQARIARDDRQVKAASA